MFTKIFTLRAQIGVRTSMHNIIDVPFTVAQSDLSTITFLIQLKLHSLTSSTEACHLSLKSVTYLHSCTDDFDSTEYTQSTELTTSITQLEGSLLKAKHWTNLYLLSNIVHSFQQSNVNAHICCINTWSLYCPWGDTLFHVRVKHINNCWWNAL